MTIAWYEILMLIGVPSIISSAVFLIVNKIIDKRKKKSGDETLLKKGVQALLRNGLLEIYDRVMKKGCISLIEKQNFDNMYQSYHSLGKNGVMDSIYEEVMKLPLEQ